jgi:hypothetical protein
MSALAVGVVFCAGCGTQERSGKSGQRVEVEGQTSLNTPGGSSLTTSSPSSTAALNESVKVSDPTLNAILRRAIEQERYRETSYRNIVRGLGPQNPFVNMIDSAVQQGETLEQLASSFGQALGSTYVAGEPAPKSLASACQLGEKIETETIALYDGLLLRISAYPEITLAFQNHRSASVDSHLPAVQNCLASVSDQSLGNETGS